MSKTINLNMQWDTSRVFNEHSTQWNAAAINKKKKQKLPDWLCL